MQPTFLHFKPPQSRAYSCLASVVGDIDQYKASTQTEIRFRARLLWYQNQPALLTTDCAVIDITSAFTRKRSFVPVSVPSSCLTAHHGAERTGMLGEIYPAFLATGGSRQHPRTAGPVDGCR